VQYEKKEFLKIPNFGKHCIQDLEDFLEEIGQEFGQKSIIPVWRK
jgi:hypothetical protein